jgi:hypothetical protein
MEIILLLLGPLLKFLESIFTGVIVDLITTPDSTEVTNVSSTITDLLDAPSDDDILNRYGGLLR